METKKIRIILLGLVVFVIVIFFGLKSISPEDEWVCQDGKWVTHGNPSEETKPVFDCKKTVDKGIAYDVYCEQNTDCACGGHISKNSCFIGNKRYIDAAKQCKKLCVDNINIQCVKNQCKQVK